MTFEISSEVSYLFQLQQEVGFAGGRGVDLAFGVLPPVCAFLRYAPNEIEC
jgi:hypothetical protein